MGIYLRAAQILPLQTLAAQFGAGWYLSGAVIQPNMWDKAFTCTEHQGETGTPTGGISRQQKGLSERHLMLWYLQRCQGLMLPYVSGRNCSPAVFPCFFLLKGRCSTRTLKSPLQCRAACQDSSKPFQQRAKTTAPGDTPSPDTCSWMACPERGKAQPFESNHQNHQTAYL